MRGFHSCSSSSSRYMLKWRPSVHVVYMLNSTKASIATASASASRASTYASKHDLQNHQVKEQYRKILRVQQSFMSTASDLQQDAVEDDSIAAQHTQPSVTKKKRTSKAKATDTKEKMKETKSKTKTKETATIGYDTEQSLMTKTIPTNDHNDPTADNLEGQSKNVFVPIEFDENNDSNNTVHSSLSNDQIDSRQLQGQRQKDEEEQHLGQVSSPTLSPWLQQLWRNGASTTTTTNETTETRLSTNDVDDNYDNNQFLDQNHIDDDETTAVTNTTKKQKKKKITRSGGSGNDFDGKGYDGNGGTTVTNNNDHNIHEEDEEYDNTSIDDSNVNRSSEDDRVPSIDHTNIDPKDTWPIDPNLFPNIRCNLSDVYKLYSKISTDSDTASNELQARDTGLSICTLGTGAGGSCRLRCNTSTVVRSGAYCYLIDAGEGVMRQFMLSRLKFNDIRKIFITHMHADHIFGLPGLLLAIQTARINQTIPHPIELYGPVGLHNYVATSLRLACIELRKLKVYVYELHGGTHRSMRSTANRKTFAEFHHHSLMRKAIPQNADGTWTLMEPMEIITPEQADKVKSGPQGFSIKAAEIHHIPELQCFGYTFQEPISQLRPLNVDLARELGINTPKSYRLLKSGFSVMNDDNSRLVHPDEVCGLSNRPRKVTVLGDCCMVPPAMESLSLNSDVLIHEATLSIHETGKKAVVGGHATSAEAAIFANKVKAQVLLLNHLPKTLNTYSKCKEWLQESESRIRGPTKVQIGYDHLEIVIPRNGFQFQETIPSKSLWPEERLAQQCNKQEHDEKDNNSNVPTVLPDHIQQQNKTDTQPNQLQQHHINV